MEEEQSVNELTGIVISRNNESTILNAINSLKPVCKEVILLDLQSSDNTKSLAHKYNVRMIMENAGKAENELLNRAIKSCKTNHLIFIYGYEVLDSKSIAPIQEILERTDYLRDAYICQVTTEIGAPVLTTKMNFRVRVVKISDYIEFKNMCQATPTVSIFENDGSIESSEIQIHNKHYKYNEEHLHSIYMQEIKQLIKYPANDPYFYFAIAKQLYHLKKYNEAIENLKKIDLSSIPDKGFLASVYNYMARAMQRKGMLNPAAKLYAKSLDLVIEQNIANVELSKIYKETNRGLEAAMCYERYYITHSSDDDAFFYYKPGKFYKKEDGYLPFVEDDFAVDLATVKQNMGAYYIENHRFDEGEELLLEVIKEFPSGSQKHYETLKALSVAYKAQEKQKELCTTLDSMLKIDLSNKNKNSMYDILKDLIEIKYQNNQLEEVTRYVQLGLQSFKYSIFFNFYRSEVYYWNKQYDKALEELNLVIKEYSKNRYKDIPLVRILELKGDCFYKLKNYVKSFETFKICLQAEPESVSILGKLGQCLILLQKPDQAKQVYTKALSIEPENQMIKDGLSQISGTAE